MATGVCADLPVPETTLRANIAAVFELRSYVSLSTGDRFQAYAKCDGCEGLCLIGECCECAGGAGEAASCCATSEASSGLCALGEGASCCCDGITVCPDCAGCSSNGKKKAGSESATNLIAEADVYSKFEGQHGVAESSLNPSGFVTIDGERVPGRSQTGEFIDAGTHVAVVSTNAFGVFVRKQTESV